MNDKQNFEFVVYTHTIYTGEKKCSLEVTGGECATTRDKVIIYRSIDSKVANAIYKEVCKDLNRRKKLQYPNL